MRNQILSILFFIYLGIQSIFAQTTERQIALEYYNNADYEKANAYFEKLFKNKKEQAIIYPQYLQTLFHLEEFSAAEKMVKKMLKAYPEHYKYKIDVGMVDLKAGNKDAAFKYFDKLISNLSSTKNVNILGNVFSAKEELLDFAEKTYLKAKKIAKNPTPFDYQLAGVYIRKNDKKKLMQHCLESLLNESMSLSYVQSTLQRTLAGDDFDKLETLLLNEVQNRPDNWDLSDLLIWLYYQKKDFYAAILQAKAIDKLQNLGGKKVMEVASIATKNKDYQSAAEAYQYVIDKYKGERYYELASKSLINVKEEQVKSTFPIDTAKIASLIADYQSLLKEFGKIGANADILKRIATLYAFYLHDIDKAVKLLEELVKIPGANKKVIAGAKLDLGDIYILKNEPWESTLLYYQVEKDNKDTPIGHEAKLRNAKLSYYKGDFDLALSHLDILKMATSREIANDAMNLSLLIRDNTALDTSYDAMLAYSKAELLVFQNKLMEALEALDNMLITYMQHTIVDEIYFLQAKIHIQKGTHDEAVKPLKIITEQYDDGILGDDALFLLAELYELHLRDKEMAKELYKSLIFNHADSIYGEEARKRFRALRGDFN